MALVVNTNVPSIASQRYLMESRNEMETAMERLSSGKRINSSADDAAGLSIATRMDTQTRGLNMAIRNANDGISIVQSAEGAMQEVTEMLQRMRELAVQSSSGANSATDRAALDAEVQALKDEINRVSETTLFNNVNLLDGSYAASMQIGSNAGDVMNISIGDISTSALGMGNGSSSSGGANVLVSGRVSLDTSTAIHAGDIEVNGVGLGGYNGAATDPDSIGTTDNNIADFVDLVNDADAGVTASAFNTVVASTVGTGIVAANELSIQVGAVGNNPVVEQVIGASTNMDELVANINLAMGGAVAASTDSAGRLVLSNSTGASISVTELSGTSGATDTGSGFQDEGGTISVYTGSATNTFNGFLRLESTNGEDITIVRGNAGLASPGSLTDLAQVGFREVSESPEGQPYSVTGIALTSGGVASAIGNNELTINGVEIYEESLSSASTSFQGKLDLINAFTTETDVIASAYFEKSFDFSNVTYVTGQTFDINGTEITMAGNLASTVANINAATGTTGVTATVNGTNVVLKGNNVQQVTIGNYEYDLDDDFEAHVAGKNHSSLAKATERTINMTDLNFATGVQITLNFATGGAVNPGGGTSMFWTGGSGKSFTYTVTSSDDRLSVTRGFRDLMTQAVENNDGTASDYDGALTALFRVTTGGAGTVYLQLAAGLSAGSAVISFTVTNPTAGYRAFSGANIGENNHYGAIRLTSIEDNPISINLGRGASVAEHGLLEMNVGAADWDNVEPSLGGTSMVSGLSISSEAGAQSAIDILDAAITQIGAQRASLGAAENRLNHTVSNLSNIVENTEAAKSRIMDTDFAKESAALARAQILQQAGTAMLAQANAAPQGVLSLLG